MNRLKSLITSRPGTLFLYTLCTLLVLTGCNQTIYLTHKNSGETQMIDARKVRTIITARGDIYEKDFKLADSIFIYQNATPIPWNHIRALEVRETRFGDVVAFPLELIGGTVALSGLLLMGAEGLSDDDDDSNTLPLLLTGLGLTGGGILINRAGHSLRPTERKSIRTIIPAQYHITTDPKQ